MLILRYALMAEDHIEANYYRFWKSPGTRKWRVRQYGTIAMYVVTGVMVIHLLAQKPLTLRDVFVSCTMLLIACIMLRPVSKLLIRRNIRKMLADPINARYLEMTELTVSDSGISDRDPVSETRYEWQAFHQFEQTKDFYYFFLDDIRTLTVPKRVFHSATEQNEFEGYINRNLSIEITFDHLKSGMPV